MREQASMLESNQTARDAGGAPFASEFVTLSKQEHIELVMQAHYFKSLHERAVARALWREGRYQRVLRLMKEQGALREAALQTQLQQAHARIKDLQQRLFGRKSERQRRAQVQGQESGAHAPRGHQSGAPGHGRKMEPNLPARHEFVEIQAAQCPQCGLPLKPFAGTEDSEILELEVKAYRRVIHRKRYTPVCQCGCLPGIVSAPPPARLINRGKFGISVWTQVLLDKFAYGRPSQRLMQDLADHDLQMAPSTLAGGLQAIAPLFESLDQALITQLRSEQHWLGRETRWAVFVDTQGKAGHRWYLWVFHARTVVHYVLDQTRSAQVVTAELAGVKGSDSILSCDRYSAYKKFARQHPGVVLAYCWAHQRRDFLELANAYPACEPWAFEWISAIGELYRLNAVRLQTLPDSAQRGAAQAQLQQAVQRLADQRATDLADPRLQAPAVKVLQSMALHWSGLTVFVNAPWVPMDNNVAERDMRGPVVGRKNFYGSGAQWSGKLAATMYSVLATLGLWQINARTWLGAYLQACADNGNRAPVDLTCFLPWAMNEARLAAMRTVSLGTNTLGQALDSS